MKVDIFVLGHLTNVIKGLKKEYLGYEVKEGVTIKEVAKELGIREELMYVFLVNRQRKDFNYILKDGDQITIFSPPAGG